MERSKTITITGKGYEFMHDRRQMEEGPSYHPNNLSGCFLGGKTFPITLIAELSWWFDKQGSVLDKCRLSVFFRCCYSCSFLFAILGWTKVGRRRRLWTKDLFIPLILPHLYWIFGLPISCFHRTGLIEQYIFASFRFGPRLVVRRRRNLFGIRVSCAGGMLMIFSFDM